MINISKRAMAGCLVAAVCLAPKAYAQTSHDTYRHLDAGKYGLLVRLPILPDRRDAFLKIMKARIEASRCRPEVVDFRVMSTADANVFVALEQFRDKAASAAFEALPESTSFLEALKPMISGSVEATVLTALP